jgi:hypothetical protein
MGDNWRVLKDKGTLTHCWSVNPIAMQAGFRSVTSYLSFGDVLRIHHLAAAPSFCVAPLFVRLAPFVPRRMMCGRVQSVEVVCNGTVTIPFPVFPVDGHSDDISRTNLAQRLAQWCVNRTFAGT